ncbi:hypothetical protein FRC11_007704 [Ceratobasidium sp. 423]|nr:hypothetical protein FRC11_007704 [Ceratobasidium sp. 423]
MRPGVSGWYSKYWVHHAWHVESDWEVGTHWLSWSFGSGWWVARWTAQGLETETGEEETKTNEEETETGVVESEAGVEESETGEETEAGKETEAGEEETKASEEETETGEEFETGMESETGTVESKACVEMECAGKEPVNDPAGGQSPLGARVNASWEMECVEPTTVSDPPVVEWLESQTDPFQAAETAQAASLNLEQMLAGSKWQISLVPMAGRAANTCQSCPIRRNDQYFDPKAESRWF